MLRFGAKFVFVLSISKLLKLVNIFPIENSPLIFPHKVPGYLYPKEKSFLHQKYIQAIVLDQNSKPN
jgi:hypothetical protein